MRNTVYIALEKFCDTGNQMRKSVLLRKFDLADDLVFFLLFQHEAHCKKKENGHFLSETGQSL